MDINLLFESGEMTCGRVLKVLPEDEIKSPKQFMAKVLRTKTMPSINHLYPVILRKTIYANELESLGVSGNYIGWRIPSRLVNGLTIQNIRSLNTGYGIRQIKEPGQYHGYYGNVGSLTSYPNRYGRYSSANLYGTVVAANLAYADSQLLGTIQEAPIPRFEPPNIMWLNRTYETSSVFDIVFCLDNDDNLLTLDNAVYEGVRRLFILDLKSSIYDLYVSWSTLDTSLGTLDLKIDDWSGCESERNELYDQFDSLSHLRRHTIISG